MEEINEKSIFFFFFLRFGILLKRQGEMFFKANNARILLKSGFQDPSLTNTSHTKATTYNFAAHFDRAMLIRFTGPMIPTRHSGVAGLGGCPSPSACPPFQLHP